MATQFRHIQNMCLAHLNPKTYVCTKSHEHWSKTEEVDWSAKFATDRPTARPTNRPPARLYADSYIPPSNLVWRGYNMFVFAFKSPQDSEKAMSMVNKSVFIGFSTNFYIGLLKISQQNILIETK